jgi:aminoglycoside phosphotransferase (APT) family kinase protein
MEQRIERCLPGFAPSSNLLRSWRLEGGISAQMTGFEIEQADGTKKKFIARQPNDYVYKSNPDAASDEFRVLHSLRAAGLPVQTPYSLEPASADVSQPFFIIEYIEGAPDIAPQDVEAYLGKYCEQLVQIHSVDLAKLDHSLLRIQGPGYGRKPEVPNNALREADIWDAVQSVAPKVRSNPPVLRHGDFWPGNVLWRAGEIVAVIDWEECLIGEPLADLAICRLDLWWILGEQAAMEFTDRYRAALNFDLTDLPYWDLCASLRPISNIHEWAPSYPELGRTDITAATMSRDHRDFVAQALSKF